MRWSRGRKRLFKIPIALGSGGSSVQGKNRILPGSGAGQRAEAREGADIGEGEPGLEVRWFGEVPGSEPALAEAPGEFGSPHSQRECVSPENLGSLQ